MVGVSGFLVIASDLIYGLFSKKEMKVAAKQRVVQIQQEIYMQGVEARKAPQKPPEKSEPLGANQAANKSIEAPRPAAPKPTTANPDSPTKFVEALEQARRPTNVDAPAKPKAPGRLAQRDKKTLAALATKEDVQEAIATLKSGDRSRVKEAADLFSTSQPSGSREEVASALLAVVREGDQFTQVACVKALAVWNSSDTVPGLLEILSNEKRDSIGREILKTLGEIGDERAIGSLVKSLDNFPQRRPAIAALQQFGDRAERALIAECKPGDTEHLKGVCEALGQIGTKACIPALEKLAKNQDFFIKAAANRALQKVRERNS